MSQGKIFINSLEAFVNIGTTAEERAEKQRLLIDVEIEPAIPFEEINDDIAKTIDYDRLSKQILKFTENYSSNLIETLATRLVDSIKAGYRVQFVAITIYKFVLPNTKHVAVRYETR